MKNLLEFYLHPEIIILHKSQYFIQQSFVKEIMTSNWESSEFILRLIKTVFKKYSIKVEGPQEYLLFRFFPGGI